MGSVKNKIILLFCISTLLLYGCSNDDVNTTEMYETNTTFQAEKVTVTETEHHLVFQDNHSMDWDFIDHSYLLKIAEYHGGSVEDRAYTIIVTLNKVFETTDCIPDVVLQELYDVDGITSYDFEEIVPSDTTKEAMRMVLEDKFDNTNGSITYIEFYKEGLR